MKPLIGHTTQETAYVVDSYPYGFKLRCKIRYWLEYRKGFGYRLMSQTTNPKKVGDVWNKPKGSTYSATAMMYLDDKGHVQHEGMDSYRGVEKILEFYGRFGAAMPEEEHIRYLFMVQHSIFNCRKEWLFWFFSEGCQKLGDMFTDPVKCMFARIITGHTSDTLPKELAVKRFDRIVELLSHNYPNGGESHYTLYHHAQLFKEKTERELPEYRIGEHLGKWSNEERMPKIGERVNVTLNKLGKGCVRCYFIEAGFVGLEVILDERPEWHVEQNGDDGANALVFGQEVEFIKPNPAPVKV